MATTKPAASSKRRRFDNDTNHILLQRYQEARSRWLACDFCDDNDDDNLEQQVEDTYRQLMRPLVVADADPTTNTISTMAGERLVLILLQSNRHAEADEILQTLLGYSARLSLPIVAYSTEAISSTTRRAPVVGTLPCAMYDNFLSVQELKHLQNVFCDPQAPYWTFHQYAVEPPSPYVSYVIPLHQDNHHNLLQLYGGLGALLIRLQQQVMEWKPTTVAQQASHCELWAHNRPSVTGHQLHFDTDNEGRDATTSTTMTKHPLLTAILYLTNNGGSTLITNQRLSSKSAADVKGWLAAPAVNRLVLMDGRVLHGVVPGKRATASSALSSSAADNNGAFHGNNRRVTLMVAFWKRIRVRDEKTPGAARPFPMDDDVSWAKALRANVMKEQDTVEKRKKCQPVHPVSLSHVYERTSDGQPWTRHMGMPDYEQIFQGV